MKKKKQHEEEGEHENSERWLLTYADLITLLVAFFIIMYSMSVVNLKKFSAVAIAIRSGFGGNLESNKGAYFISSGDAVFGEGRGNPGPAGGNRAQQERQMLQHIKRQLAVMRLDRVLEPIVDTPVEEGNQFRVILSDQLFFTPGKCDLDQKTRIQVMALEKYIKNVPSKITVEGYCGRASDTSSTTDVTSATVDATDTAGGNTNAMMDSWAISAERARSVINVMVKDCGINPRRLSLKANGDWTAYGSSRRLMLTSGGAWKEMTVDEEKDAHSDRVVIWILID